MKDLPEYRASHEDVARLLAEQPMVRLVTTDPDGWPRVGLHVHVTNGLAVELHLANDDPQLDDIRRTGRAVVEVDRVLAFAPSHWVDEENAAHADQFFCCASLRGEPTLESDRAAVVGHLRALLARHQPEGGYVDVEDGHPLYAGYLGRLTLVRLRPTEVLTKFKVAQTTSAAARSRIVERLRVRGGETDRATIMAMEGQSSR